MEPILWGIALTTLLSEDLACIGAGALVAQGVITLPSAIAACVFGIFIGDLLLFLCGRFIGISFLPPERVAEARQWLSSLGLRAVLLSRFTPGLRLPTYFAAGVLKLNPWRFSAALLLASLIWTPILVGATAKAGAATARTIAGSISSVMAVVLLLAGARVLMRKLRDQRFRRGWTGRWRRWTQWEFWPAWAAYLPMAPYFVWLALRSRSLTAFTASNPGIASGGLTGESKSRILEHLRALPECVPEFTLIPACEPFARRKSRSLTYLKDNGLDFPIIAKPDVGERGHAVRLLRNEAELDAYLLEHAASDTILQRYVGGLEFGVFYVRRPGEPSGSIPSITAKRFPNVEGDGSSTIEDLVMRDERAVCLIDAYRASCRRPMHSVPYAGEVVSLVEIGSHCRGAIFDDASRLTTPALEAAIDRIARMHPGFYIGRFDLRVPSRADLQAGRNLSVLELNGVGAEATHIYDPAVSIVKAYSSLMRQWRWAFEIGMENQRRGAKAMSLNDLFQLVRGCFNSKPCDTQGTSALPLCPDTALPAVDPS